MSTTGLDTFDRTLQTTHIWLDELMKTLGPDRQTAWHVLGAVLRALRNHLPLGLAVHLGAQLPLLVRGAYYGQWDPAGEQKRSRTQKEFLEEIARELASGRRVNPRTCVEAVFLILSRHVDRGQIEKVRNALPESLRALWPESDNESSTQAEGQLVQVRDEESPDDPTYYIVAEKNAGKAEDIVKAVVSTSDRIKAVGPVTLADLATFGLKPGQFTHLRPAP
jgi:uncharacterized protein (DUF2267 family)